MRPIESVLLLANLLAFFVLAVRLPRAVRWVRHLAPIALPIAGAQVLLEGPRWQMVPAYALAVLFFVVWLLRYVTPAGPPGRNGPIGWPPAWPSGWVCSGWPSPSFCR